MKQDFASALGRYPTELAAAHAVGARVLVIERLPHHSTTSVVDEVKLRGQTDPRQTTR
jgi:hypothetical protein